MRVALPTVIVLGLIVGAGAGMRSAAGADPGQEQAPIPASFAPFEHFIGAWKGMAIPAANRLKGWPETHLWAWKFIKGEPVGMTLTVEGGKVVAQGQLTYDPASKRYRLEGTDSAGKPVVFLGALDSSGKSLALDRQGSPSAEGGSFSSNCR